MPNFIKLLDPRPWIALVVAIAVLFCIVKYKDAIRQVDQLKTQIAQDRANASAVALENERRMTNDLSAIASKHQQELEYEKIKNDKLIADVRAGAVRLSIPVKNSSACSSTNPALADGNRPETRAELTPAAGIALAAIAADGDDAIRQLNACIDSYQAIRIINNVQAP